MTAVTGETGAGKTLSSRPSSCWSAGGPTPRWCATARPRRWSRAASCVDGERDRAAPGRARPTAGRGPTSTAGWPPRRAGRAGRAARRPARPARPPVAARSAGAARRARPVRRHRPRARCRGPQGAARRSSASWPSSAATSGRGPARSTCCGSRSTSSTRPGCPIPTRTSSSTLVEDRAGRRPGPPGGGPRRARAARRRRRCVGRRGRRRWPPSTGGRPFAELVSRLRSVEAELADVASEVRAVGEAIEDDPARLAEVQERRRLLHELRRKYGDTCWPRSWPSTPRPSDPPGRSWRTATGWPLELDARRRRCWPSWSGRAGGRPGPARRRRRAWPTRPRPTCASWPWPSAESWSRSATTPATT